jgi:hypothetical protein
MTSVGGTFNSAKQLQATERNQILYIADHSDVAATSATTNQPKKFDPTGPTVSNWTAADGTIPKGSIALVTWRDRAVFAGGTDSPFGVFASRLGDFEDWDYSETDTGAAWSIITSDAGRLGDSVMALVPYSDDCLVIFCSTSIWICRGDPGFGGTLDNISRHIGCLGPHAWCLTPEGLIVFLSQDGLYVLPAGCSATEGPTSISREMVPEEMLPFAFRNPDPGIGLWFDTNLYAVSLEYDLRNRGIIIALTPHTAGSTSSTHWWFDWETKGLWQMTLGSVNQEPFCLHSRINFVPASTAHSSVMWGGRNGYIYRLDNTANTDDGNAFSSSIWFGPFEDPSMFSDLVITELVGELARKSGQVMWEIYVGETPEEAFVAGPREAGVWVAGRNYTAHPRTRGGSQYLKLSNLDSSGWGFERAFAILQKYGRHRP